MWFLRKFERIELKVWRKLVGGFVLNKGKSWRRDGKIFLVVNEEDWRLGLI